MTTVTHLIHGEMIAGTGRSADVFNPSTGEVSKQVALADRATMQLAIDSAKSAFPAWRNTRRPSAPR